MQHINAHILQFWGQTSNGNVTEEMAVEVPDIFGQTPPPRIATDYVELVVLIVMFIAGGPINLAACNEMMTKRGTTRLDVLKRHLNYSDLMVLFIYTPSRVCWLITYDWRGGDFLCRLAKFAHMLSFQISTNLIVCIALDRLFWVIWPLRDARARATTRTRILIGIAWFIAVLQSLPQLIVFRSYEFYPHWQQCLTMWNAMRRDQSLRFFQHQVDSANATTLEEKEHLLNSTHVSSFLHRVQTEPIALENIYNIVHQLASFWIPVFIIFLSYAIISCWVARQTNANTENRGRRRSHGLGDTTILHYTQAPPAIVVSLCENETPKNGSLPTPNMSRKTHLHHQRCSIGANTKAETSGNTVHHNTAVDTADTVGESMAEECELSPLRENSANTRPTVSFDTMVTDDTYTIVQRVQKARLVKRKAIRVSVLLIGAYLICWLPYNTMSAWALIDPVTYRQYSDILYCLFGLIVFNSVINPFLYGMFGQLASVTRND